MRRYALGVYELVQRRERPRGRGFVLTGRRGFALTAEAVHSSRIATAGASGPQQVFSNVASLACRNTLAPKGAVDEFVAARSRGPRRR